MPIKTIIFTFKRPLQFYALLESFIHYSKANLNDVYVLTPSDENYWDEIQHWNVNWVFEETFGGFDIALKSLIREWDDDQPILFLCDDTIFFNHFELEDIETALKDPQTIGFSLRLGKQLPLYLEEWNKSSDPKFVKIDYRGKPNDFGYPFELSASAYRKELVQKVIDYCEQQGRNINIPNVVESQGFYYTHAYRSSDQPCLQMFNGTSLNVAQDANRVQDQFPNSVKTNKGYTSEKLLELYKEGYRIDWRKLEGYIPPSLFIGDSVMELVKK